MSIFGINYLARADALVAVAADGSIYVLDRKTGEQLLEAPVVLPGAPGVARTLSPELTPELSAEVGALVAPFLKLPPGLDFEKVLHIIFGEGVVVANFFAIDADTGAIYFAATAPDEKESCSMTGACTALPPLVASASRYHCCIRTSENERSGHRHQHSHPLPS